MFARATSTTPDGRARRQPTESKQLDVRPEGWESAVGDYAEDAYRSVADVVDPASLQKVRDFKKAQKAAGKAAATASVPE